MTIEATLAGRAGAAPGLTPFRLADGTVLAVQDLRPRDADAGSCVVLVPGWTQDHTSWEDVVAELRRRHPTLRVVVPEARGHGWSDAGPPGTYTIDQLADDVAEVVDRLVPETRVVLAGHSLGGPIVIALARRHSELVRRRVVGVALVATSAAGLGRDLFGLPSRVLAPALLIEPTLTGLVSRVRTRTVPLPAAVLAPFIRRGFYGPGADTPRNRRRTAAQVARAHPPTAAALVDEMVRHDELHGLDVLAGVPSVVLVGTKDGLCPIAHSRAIAAELTGAELVVYPGAGHMLPYERPVEVADVLAGLAEQRPSAAEG